MNNLSLLKKSPDGIRFFDYADILGIQSGTIIKNNGFSYHDYRSFIKQMTLTNRSGKRAGEKIAIDLVQLTQKHTNLVIAADGDIEIPADGLYSNRAGHVLLIKTADCFPLFLTDGLMSALIHVGWRGLFGGIIKNLFATVPDFKVAQAKAVIGPGIEACCFVVGAEVAMLFPAKRRIFKDDRHYLDLPAIIVDELADFGIKSITRCKTCTACNPDLLCSFRREGRKVRQMYSYILAGG